MAAYSSTPNPADVVDTIISQATVDNLEEQRSQKLRSLRGKDSSGLTRRSRSRSPSPQQRPLCCFGCWTRKAPGQKGKSKGSEFDGMKWGRSDSINLTDVGTFSFKEQSRKLKKARKEEEKACKEAAKVVDWVKQASATMDVSVIDQVLTDDEELK